MSKSLLLVALLLAVANATHYRFGTWSWQPTGGTGTRHSIQQAFRRSYYGAVNVGTQFGEANVVWGDNSAQTPLRVTCTSVDLVADIASGEAVLTHNYPSLGFYTATWSSCCRLSSLQNNGDQSNSMFTEINLAHTGNRSPVANVLPITPVPRGSPYCFQIAAADADGDTLTFSLATFAQSSASSHPPGTSITSSGLYCWSNQNLNNGLWNTAVVISDGKSRIMVDFLMQLTTQQATNRNPVWVRGPTPPNGQYYSANLGDTVSFTLQCSDPDLGNTVTITTGSLPQGSSLNPQSGTNPGSRFFTFTSNAIQTAVVCFSCTDQAGLATIDGSTCATIEFIGGCCDLNTQAPTLNGVPSDLSLQCGASIPAVPTVTASRVCPDNTAVVVTPSISDVGGACNRVITRTWSYTNECGRTATASQTITVRDTQAPTISVPSGVTLQCGVQSPVAGSSITGTATATDNCDSSVSISSNDQSISSSCLSVARIQRTWTATDDCNNQASGVQTLTIVDTVAPSLVVPADRTLECAVDSSQPSATGYATASDSCDASVVPSYSDASSPSACLAVGSIARTWSVSDDCGNSNSGVQTLTFRDTLPPTTSADPVCLSPPNGQYYCFDTTNPDFIHFNDLCSTTTLAFNNDCQDANGATSGCRLQGTQLCLKASTDHQVDTVYSFSFTVTDACGNRATQAATVTVPNTGSAGCRTPSVCINDCPEERCLATVYDLYNEATGDIVGEVRINNKLDYELQVEVITNEGTVPDRGWWMFGLRIVVGSVRISKDWSAGSAQSRWYSTIDLNRALSTSHECGDKIPVFVSALVTNDKRNSNPPTFRAFTQPRASGPTKRTGSSGFTLPSNIEDYTEDYTVCCECTIRTQTQNDYGNLCYAPTSTPTRTTQSARIRDIACYENNFWTWSQPWCFPNGLQIGCAAGHTATWTNPVAAATYWADESTPGVLTRDWTNPPNRALGYLAGETAALTLNVKFDTCDADFASSCLRLEDLRVCEHPDSIHNECRPWWGRTVSQILGEANAVVGGCQQGDVNALWQCVRYINRAFVDGKRLWEAADFVTTPTCPASNCKRTGSC